jgi:hypothetical protein
MFGLFKKKSKVDELQERYRKLIKQSYDLSTTNRAESDLKQAEAHKLLDEIDKLKEVK